MEAGPGIKKFWKLWLLLTICCNFVEKSAESAIAQKSQSADTANQGCEKQQTENKWEKETDIVQEIIKRFQPENMRKNLEYLSAKPHLAASPRDEELAKFVQSRFEEAGFDSSELVPYSVYLSKPNPDNPNKVTLLKNGEKIFESNHKETAIHAGDDDPDFVHAFNAYTPAGTVSTSPGVGVVYVNYGEYEDFKMLESLGVNVTGHIAMARYGKIYRGNKIDNADKFGARGMIIFSDPNDVALEGIDPEDVYDNSWWLPGTGMQRGSAYLGDGDPLTPGWPSTDHAYRLEVEEAYLPKIPGQPIGYADAREILMRLAGDDAPAEWQGGLPGITYKLGPLFDSENSEVSLTLSTHNVGKIEKSYNVIGIIQGSIEPDRYVMVGNHRDAWGFGAADPSSGTAQILETARVYGTLLKEGWRPRRTMVFCSWGSEEYGLLGSTEWVEEHINKIQERTVGYINTDTCTSGPALYISASPLMYDVFYDVTKMMPGVFNESITLYDEWMAYNQRLYPEKTIEEPLIEGLGSGSDFGPFSIFGGVPAADIWFRRDKARYNITTYPFYHTGYETFYMVSTFVDPEFKIHQGCGRLAALALKYLSDSTLLPYSLSRFPALMKKSLKESKNRDTLLSIYDQYVELENSVDAFEEAVKKFEEKIKLSKDLSPLFLRAMNDQMMKLEQIFVIPEGLPGRPTTRNAIFSPSQFDNYAADGFPGLTDLLHKYDTLTATVKAERAKSVRRHVSDLIIMTDRATSYLKDTYMI